MSKLDDLIDELAKEYKPETDINGRNEPKIDTTEYQKLREFFFGLPSRNYGRCPRCYNEGRIHLSTFICETHGEFK